MERETALETVVPFRGTPSRMGIATMVRSTLIAASMESLRARGLYDRYAVRLAEAERSELATVVGGAWIPMSLATAHYRACDSLRLCVGEQLDVALKVGMHLHGTFLGAMLRMARTVGVTPWGALAYTDKLYDRLFRGGGIAVTRVGPKDARVDLVGNPLCQMEYFRVGVRGVYQAALELFCERLVTREVPRRYPEFDMAVRISWA
ncbi:MAG TPA: hypothetical protein VGG39_12375 [Polyangiaceae bacterium]|jgi:hypothetical protein